MAATGEICVDVSLSVGKYSASEARSNGKFVEWENKIYENHHLEWNPAGLFLQDVVACDKIKYAGEMSKIVWEKGRPRRLGGDRDT